jgi:aminopeptidase-like protein
MYKDIIGILDGNHRYRNLNPKCEPQLGKRGLYDLPEHASVGKDFQLGLLWVLSLSDGSNSLLDISERSGIDFELIRRTAEKLVEYKLLIKID